MVRCFDGVTRRHWWPTKPCAAATAAVVITASHNPQDNGYKVYDRTAPRSCRRPIKIAAAIAAVGPADTVPRPSFDGGAHSGRGGLLRMCWPFGEGTGSGSCRSSTPCMVGPMALLLAAGVIQMSPGVEQFSRTVAFTVAFPPRAGRLLSPNAWRLSGALRWSRQRSRRRSSREFRARRDGGGSVRGSSVLLSDFIWSGPAVQTLVTCGFDPMLAEVAAHGAPRSPDRVQVDLQCRPRPQTTSRSCVRVRRGPRLHHRSRGSRQGWAVGRAVVRRPGGGVCRGR
jgi:hypothetical protein